MEGERFENSSIFARYYQGEVVGRERLTREQVELEKGMFGLRTFALETHLANPSKVRDLEEAGLIKTTNSHISPTPT